MIFYNITDHIYVAFILGVTRKQFPTPHTILGMLLK